MEKILQKDSSQGHVLRLTSKDIPTESLPNDDINNDLEKMHKALKSQRDGVALAAPQIGISKRIFVVAPFIFDQDPENTQLVFINPQIIKQSKDKKKMDEGCLSVRGKYGKVRRTTRATVAAYNEKGEQFTLNGSGLLAQIFQHEIDHLDGILFIDKATDVQDVDVSDNHE